MMVSGSELGAHTPVSSWSNLGRSSSQSPFRREKDLGRGTRLANGSWPSQERSSTAVLTAGAYGLSALGALRKESLCTDAQGGTNALFFVFSRECATARDARKACLGHTRTLRNRVLMLAAFDDMSLQCCDHVRHLQWLLEKTVKGPYNLVNEQ